MIWTRISPLTSSSSKGLSLWNIRYELGDDEDEDILVPLVDCMVMDEYRFYLDSAHESLIDDGAVVDIESDD